MMVPSVRMLYLDGIMTQIMVETVRHVTSGLGHMKLQAT